MEYLQGGELDRVHFEKNEEKIREIAIQAAGALAYCHNNLILHKDVKPGNFFFRDKAQKQLVLGDFGIASLCDEDEMMHQTQQARTPIYAAPEMYITIDDNVEIVRGPVNGVLIHKNNKTLAIYGDPRPAPPEAEYVLFTHHRRDGKPHHLRELRPQVRL